MKIEEAYFFRNTRSQRERN